jgi:hypothetical protein
MASRGILSVDVEDYFQVEAFTDTVNRYDWPRYASRVEPNTERVLDLLDELDVRATFFILGWTARQYPRLVRKIVQRGHEPACHSYWHRRVYRLTAREFQEDTARAKDVIEPSGRHADLRISRSQLFHHARFAMGL